MVYDPVLQKWDGNEDILTEFDLAPPPTKRPSLITNIGGSKVPQSIGGMVFDPVKMCWVGNDEEEDIFADFEDDFLSSSPQKPITPKGNWL
jgi:hypothetical protein